MFLAAQLVPSKRSAVAGACRGDLSGVALAKTEASAKKEARQCEDGSACPVKLFEEKEHSEFNRGG